MPAGNGFGRMMVLSTEIGGLTPLRIGGWRSDQTAKGSKGICAKSQGLCGFLGQTIGCPFHKFWRSDGVNRRAAGQTAKNLCIADLAD